MSVCFPSTILFFQLQCQLTPLTPHSQSNNPTLLPPGSVQDEWCVRSRNLRKRLIAFLQRVLDSPNDVIDMLLVHATTSTQARWSFHVSSATQLQTAPSTASVKCKFEFARSEPGAFFVRIWGRCDSLLWTAQYINRAECRITAPSTVSFKCDFKMILKSEIQSWCLLWQVLEPP